MAPSTSCGKSRQCRILSALDSPQHFENDADDQTPSLWCHVRLRLGDIDNPDVRVFSQPVIDVLFDGDDIMMAGEYFYFLPHAMVPRIVDYLCYGINLPSGVFNT